MNTKSFLFGTFFVIVLAILASTIMYGGNIIVAILGALSIILLLTVAYVIYEEDSLDREDYKRRMDAYRELTDSIRRL